MLKCPHCAIAIHFNPSEDLFHKYESSISLTNWTVKKDCCPSCGKLIIQLREEFINKENSQTNICFDEIIYPKAYYREPLSSDVPTNYSQDYQEACRVISVSPKASAALSRRCLQNLLREKANIQNQSNLHGEIEEVIKSNQLPNYLADGLHDLRKIGNLAAHPTKNTITGEILEVEIGEAECLLDTLEGLFDFYFVLPAKTLRNKEILKDKLEKKSKFSD